MRPEDEHANEHKIPALIHAEEDGYSIRKAWWFGKILEFSKANDFLEVPNSRWDDSTVKANDGEEWHVRLTCETVPVARWFDYRTSKKASNSH